MQFGIICTDVVWFLTAERQRGRQPEPSKDEGILRQKTGKEPAKEQPKSK